MTSLGLPIIQLDNLPMSISEVLSYLSYLNLKGLAPSTTTTYVSALGFVHRMNNMKDPTNAVVVQKVLSAINKIQGNLDARLPITQFILHRLLNAADYVVSNMFHRSLIKAMFSIAFYGLFRIGEITIQKSGAISLNFSQIQVLKDTVLIPITLFKNNKSNKPFDIVIHRQDGPYCPYVLLVNYLNLRGDGPGPLFCFSNYHHVSRCFFTTKLKACLSFCGLDTKLYLSHSFRIGGSSYLASMGMSDLQIKLMGRWSSDSFIRYIRNQKFHIKHA